MAGNLGSFSAPLMSTRVRLFAALAALLPATVAAQTLVYPSFGGTTGLQLNDASVSGGAVLLASNASDRRGSVFTTSQYSVAGFSAIFQFRISSPGGISDGTSAGADGLAFVLQRQGATALGGAGEALGYGPRGSAAITPSVAVEFDTFTNSWDPGSNHVGLNVGGNLTSLQAVEVGNAFDDGSIWTVWVDYDGTSVAIRLSQDGQRPSLATLSRTLNIVNELGGATAHVGFTAATGSAFGRHELLGFAFSETYLANGLAAVPEPSTWVLLFTGLAVLALAARRRR